MQDISVKDNKFQFSAEAEEWLKQWLCSDECYVEIPEKVESEFKEFQSMFEKEEPFFEVSLYHLLNDEDTLDKGFTTISKPSSWSYDSDIFEESTNSLQVIVPISNIVIDTTLMDTTYLEGVCGKSDPFKQVVIKPGKYEAFLPN